MLSVVIPTYNEEESIVRSLRRLRAYLVGQGIPHEIIVADDGSADRTRAAIRDASLPGVVVVGSSRNHGKGYAVRLGVRLAKGDAVLFMDADLSTALEEIPLFLRLGRQYDVVIGSRRVPGARLAVRQPWHRRLAGWSFNLFVRCFAVRGFHDTQCGFKLFSAAAAKSVFSRAKIDGFAFDVELLFLARRMGFSVGEVGVSWRDDSDSRVSLRRHVAPMLLDVLFVRCLHARGFARRCSSLHSLLSPHAPLFLPYLFFSGVATLVDMASLFVLTEFVGMYYLVSAAFAYVLGALVHFVLNKRFTFRNRSLRVARQFGVHLGVALVGLLLNQLLLFLLVDFIGVWYMAAKALAVLIVLLWSFFGHSRFTFGWFS